LHNGADDLKSFKCLTQIGVNSPKEMKLELLLKLRPHNRQAAGGRR
jgi:hypothetical protein